MYVCIKKYDGTQGEVCQQLKIFLPPTVVYATYRSKAVVPVLFLFCVALWFILRSASCFKVFPCSLSSCFFISFSIVIASLGEEGAGLCASRAFVCLFLHMLVSVIFLFLLVSGVGCGWMGLDAVCDCGTPWTFLLTFIAQNLQNGQCSQDHVAHLCSLIRIYDLIMGL